jgi:hypothetical protein
MKPCSHNRKSLAWLAANTLDPREEGKLRAHLQICAPCRTYLEELTALSEKLESLEVRSDIESSEAFHRGLLGRLRSEKRRPTWDMVVGQLQAWARDWRMAGLGTAAAVVFLALSSHWRGPPPPAAVASAPLRPLPMTGRNLDPTLSNYQMAANRSPETLDDLLTRQANTGASADPIYKASSLARAGSLE